MALAKVGDLVTTNVETTSIETPSQWGIVVQIDKRKPRRGLAQYVRVQWGCESRWHKTYKLKIVSEAL